MKQTLYKNTIKKMCMPTIVYTNHCINVSHPYTQTNKTKNKSMGESSHHHINKI